ncbi:MAG: MMPL family transporter [Sandaracinaceae bacterium]|nr:MMPL family transporter [Sandaracinaceae bacterium]
MGEPGGVLERVARVVTRRRGTVLGAIALTTALAASALPSLEADPSPERLMSGVGEHARGAERLRAHFGDTDMVVLLIVSAEDVLRPGPLTYMHRVSRRLGALPEVERVDGITVIPLPRREDARDEGLTLDDLDAELESEESPTFAGPEVLEALAAIAAAGGPLPGRARLRRARGRARLGRAHRRGRRGRRGGGERARALARGLAARPWPLRQRGPERGARRGALGAGGPWLPRDARRGGADRRDPPSRASPAGVELIVGGLPHLRASIVDKMLDDQVVLVPATLAVCLVLLFLAFRWLPGMLLPLAAVLVTAVMVMGAMAAAGQPLDILNNVVPALLISIGVCDSIHLLSRYREELRDGTERVAAAERTLRQMALACFLTSGTTAVGFGSLLVAETQMLRRFGVTAALGVLLAYVVTITFLPAAMTAFRAPPSGGGRLLAAVERVVASVTAAVLRRPWSVLGASAVLVIVCAVAAWRVEVGSRLVDHFDEGDEVSRAARVLDTKLDGLLPLEVIITSARGERFRDPAVLGAIERTARWLEDQPGVRRVTTPAAVLRETWFLLTGEPRARERPFVSSAQVGAFMTLLAQRDPDPLRSHLSADGAALRMEVRLADLDAGRTLALIAALEDRLARELAAAGAGDLEVTMAGEAYASSRGTSAVMRDLSASLLTSVALIFVMLLLLFRSVRLSLISIPPNVIPLIATAAWMSVRGIPLDIATVIIFSVSVGLAVDGTIHVLARFREETAAGDELVDASLLRAARGTGGAIAISSVTLALGFGVMLLSAFVPVRPVRRAHRCDGHRLSRLDAGRAPGAPEGDARILASRGHGRAVLRGERARRGYLRAIGLAAVARASAIAIAARGAARVLRLDGSDGERRGRAGGARLHPRVRVRRRARAARGARGAARGAGGPRELRDPRVGPHRGPRGARPARARHRRRAAGSEPRAREQLQAGRLRPPARSRERALLALDRRGRRARGLAARPGPAARAVGGARARRTLRSPRLPVGRGALHQRGRALRGAGGGELRVERRSVPGGRRPPLRLPPLPRSRAPRRAALRPRGGAREPRRRGARGGERDPARAGADRRSRSPRGGGGRGAHEHGPAPGADRGCRGRGGDRRRAPRRSARLRAERAGGQHLRARLAARHHRARRARRRDLLLARPRERRSRAADARRTASRRGPPRVPRAPGAARSLGSHRRRGARLRRAPLPRAARPHRHAARTGRPPGRGGAARHPTTRQRGALLLRARADGEPALAGSVELAFEVEPSGSAASARVTSTTLSDASVESCITGAVGRWTFPAPRGGSVSVDVRFDLDSFE